MFPIQEEAWAVCSLPGCPGDILSFGEADPECLHIDECLHTGHCSAACGNESVSALFLFARLHSSVADPSLAENVDTKAVQLECTHK